MKLRNGLYCLIFGVIFLFTAPAFGAIATFDDLTLASESYWNGSDESGVFVSGDAAFSNGYNTAWGSWDGWAYSNMTDSTTAGYSNQFSAIAGGGAVGSANYGVAYDGGAWGMASPPSASFGAGTGEDYDTTIAGAYFTNTTYAYLSMRDGDGYVTAFGANDWQMITIKGIDATGSYTASAIEFLLADFRSADGNDWYIVDDWTYVDMTGLGDIVGFEIDFSGSQDTNVPAYVAMDNLNAVPVPAAVWMLGSGLIGLVGLRRRTSA